MSAFCQVNRVKSRYSKCESLFLKQYMVAIVEDPTRRPSFEPMFSIQGYRTSIDDYGQKSEELQPLSLRRKVIRNLIGNEIPMTSEGRLPIQFSKMITGDIWFSAPRDPVTSPVNLHGLASLLIDDNLPPFRRQSARELNERITPERLTYEETVARIKRGKEVEYIYPEDGEIRWEIGKLLAKLSTIPSEADVLQRTEIAIYPNLDRAKEVYGKVRSAIREGKTSVFDIEKFFIFNAPRV